MKSARLIFSIGALWTLLVVLLTIKLGGVAALSWWLVLAPIYGYPLAICIIVAGIVLGELARALFARRPR